MEEKNKEEKESQDLVCKPKEEAQKQDEARIKEKNRKKIKAKPDAKKKNWIPVAIVVSVSILVGGGGGYLLYRWQNPESATLAGAGFEGYVPSKDEIQKSISNNSLEKDYEGKFYQLVNYALSIQGQSKYALTIGKAKVVANAGVSVTQNIVSCNYTTPEGIYNQNVSSSSVVKTANRFYDNLDGKVLGYLESVPDDWKKNNTPKEYTYDEYIQSYGKLLQGSYYCTTVLDSSHVTEATPISDRYLTSDKSVYDSSSEKSKHHVNGVVIYLIGPSSVKNSSLEKKDDGYLISLDLYTDKDRKSASDEEKKKISIGNTYYSVQMRTTGGLNSRPSFSLTHLEFTLDEELQLVSTYFKDEYSATVGPISSTTASDMYQYYFRSESNVFSGVEVTIPKSDDPDNFAGYQLFPQEA